MAWGWKSKDTELEPVAAEADERYEDTVPSLPGPLSSTVIAAGVTVVGTLKGEGVIQVEGMVDGEIRSQGVVIVAPGGMVKGPVTAEVIQVAGQVKGSCVARNRVHLEKTGSLEGDVTTPSLVVVEGGRFNGCSNMVREVPEGQSGGADQDLQFGPNYQADGEGG